MLHRSAAAFRRILTSRGMGQQEWHGQPLGSLELVCSNSHLLFWGGECSYRLGRQHLTQESHDTNHYWPQVVQVTLQASVPESFLKKYFGQRRGRSPPGHCSKSLQHCPSVLDPVPAAANPGMQTDAGLGLDANTVAMVLQRKINKDSVAICPNAHSNISGILAFPLFSSTSLRP